MAITAAQRTLAFDLWLQMAASGRRTPAQVQSDIQTILTAVGSALDAQLTAVLNFAVSQLNGSLAAQQGVVTDLQSQITAATVV